MVYNSPGSKAFSCEIGSGPNQASELVWLHGRVAPSRTPGLQVNLIAVCAADPSAPEGRRVLGFVAGRLADPRVDSGFEEDDAIVPRSRAVEAIALAAGLRYADVEVEYGDNVNKRFPGAAPGLLAAGWSIGLAYIVGWGVLFPAILIAAANASVWVVVGAACVGAVFIAGGVAVLPPSMAARERRRRARSKK